jgi:hypothetical protein
MTTTARKTYRTIDPTKVKELKSALVKLPEAKKAELSKSEVIRELRGEIDAARKKGYTYKQIGEILTEKAGTTISGRAIQLALSKETSEEETKDATDKEATE